MSYTASSEGPPSLGTTLKPLVFLAVAYALWRFYSKPRPKPSLRSVAILVLGDIGRSPRMMYHAESFATNKFQTYLIGYGGESSYLHAEWMGRVGEVLGCSGCLVPTYPARPTVVVMYSPVNTLHLGSKPIPSLLSMPRIQFMYLNEPPSHWRGFPFIIAGPLKVLHQVVDIFRKLLVDISQPPEFILVQVRDAPAEPCIQAERRYNGSERQNPPSIPTLAIVWCVSKLRGCKVIIDWHNLGFSILALRLGEQHTFVKIAKR